MDIKTARSALLHAMVRRAEKEASAMRPWAPRVTFARIATAAEKMAACGWTRAETVSGACTVKQLDRLLGRLPSVKAERRKERDGRRLWVKKVDDEHRVLAALERWEDGLKFYEIAASAGFDEPEDVHRILKRLEQDGVVVDNGERGWSRVNR